MQHRIDPRRASEVIRALLTDLSNDALVHNHLGERRRVVTDELYQKAKGDLLKILAHFDDLSDQQAKL